MFKRIMRMYRNWEWRNWSRVPPPEWAAKRSGRDYW